MQTQNLAVATLLTIAAVAAAARRSAQDRPPIIDVHVHAYATDERWTRRVPNPRTGRPLTATTERAHMHATLAEMKKYNIVKAVVSNDYQVVMRWREAAPGQILAFGFLRALLNSGLGKRLMFGSDQMVWPDAIGLAVEGIESASFPTEEQKRDIFYNNAVRITGR